MTQNHTGEVDIALFKKQLPNCINSEIIIITLTVQELYVLLFKYVLFNFSSVFVLQKVDYYCEKDARLFLEYESASSGRAQFDLYAHEGGQFGPGAATYGFDYVGCMCSTTDSCVDPAGKYN